MAQRDRRLRRPIARHLDAASSMLFSGIDLPQALARHSHVRRRWHDDAGGGVTQRPSGWSSACRAATGYATGWHPPASTSASRTPWLMQTPRCWPRRNVLVEPEEVRRIVFPLQCDEPIILTTVRGPHPLDTFIAADVVHVHAFGHERPHRGEEFARPADMAICLVAVRPDR